MTRQYGFYFDADRCVRCHACEVACKSARNVELGVKWRQVIEIWAGEFPDVTRTFVSLSCLHCAEPACEKACPTRAITKRAEDGIVVVDIDKCNGCQECYDACPYHVPQFGADDTMQKCDFCTGQGIEPACVSPCPASALFYGTMEELTKIASEKKAEKLDGPTKPSMFMLNTQGNIITHDNLVIR